MPIEHSPETKIFFLHAGGTTYAIKVLEQGYLAHLYWGPRLAIRIWTSSCSSVNAPSALIPTA